ncbi:MAG: DKNYY domain-containing protein [Candidatus Peribacteria bacterium]|nr:DKNYY domain-containing protein [Candidatus Peribacteria bacterium]
MYGQTDYSRDKSHVYANAALITGADAKTFKVIGGIEWFDAFDKYGFYL